MQGASMRPHNLEVGPFGPNSKLRVMVRYVCEDAGSAVTTGYTLK
jgi:hypothetical protein